MAEKALRLSLGDLLAWAGELRARLEAYDRPGFEQEYVDTAEEIAELYACADSLHYLPADELQQYKAALEELRNRVLNSVL